MNIKLTKFLLPLAALALVSTACDPFPAKPGGDPAIVRVVTYGPGGDSNTVETVTGGNTVSTDYAWLDDTIRVQFNKPMDGSTIQGSAQYDSDGKVIVDPVTGDPVPCLPASSFGVSTFPAGTTVCYDPASATNGGSAVITPGDLLVYGTIYTVTGTVKDYQGKSLTLNVTVTVDKRPLPFAVDGYTTGIDWFDSGTATTYDVLVASSAAGPYTALFTGLLPADVCTAGLCEVLDTEKAPDTKYFYQVIEGTVARPDAVGPATTLGALTPTLGVATTTPPPPAAPVILKGIIRVAWGAIQGSNGYDVETSPDGAIWTLYSHHTTTPRTVYVGTPAPGTTVPTVDGTLTSGDTYYVRVTPTYADGFVAAKGNTASKVAP